MVDFELLPHGNSSGALLVFLDGEGAVLVLECIMHFLHEIGEFLGFWVLAGGTSVEEHLLFA